MHAHSNYLICMRFIRIKRYGKIDSLIDTTATIFLMLVVFVRLLFNCSIRNHWWVNKATQLSPKAMEPFAVLCRHLTSLQLNTMWQLIDAGSSTSSLLVLLAVMEMNCRTCTTTIVLAQWLLSANVCRHICSCTVCTSCGYYTWQLYNFYSRTTTFQG